MQSIFEFLPESLKERIHFVKMDEQRATGQFVLYWMRTAIRVDENPALDVSIRIANAFGLSVLVYHGLSERYPYASDRHH
ncbi:MAG: hypothetical protein ACOVLE_11270, partial [Pirellula staleyi]